MNTLQHLVWSHLLICTHLLDMCVCVCLIAQLCLTFCDRIDCSPLGSCVHGDSPGKNSGVGCQVLLQGIFPTQGSNLGLPHCRQILYCLSHQRFLILVSVVISLITNEIKHLFIYLAISYLWNVCSYQFFFWLSSSLFLLLIYRSSL